MNSDRGRGQGAGGRGQGAGGRGMSQGARSVIFSKLLLFKK